MELVVRYKASSGKAMKLEGKANHFPVLGEEFFIITKNYNNRAVRIDFGVVTRIIHGLNYTEITTEEGSVFFVTEKVKENNLLHLPKSSNIINIVAYKESKNKELLRKKTTKLMDQLKATVISLKSHKLSKKD